METGAGPIFVRKAELFTTLILVIRHRPLLHIYNTNKRLQGLMDAFNSLIKAAAYIIRLIFHVSETIAVSMILEDDVCDRIVRVILVPK